MKKKVFIWIGAIVLLLAILFSYLNYRNRTVSPPGNTALTVNGLSVSIPYSRPSVRGRLIFGTKEQNALLPYGKYWRLGANESTEITINKAVFFNGQPLKAGTYRMYAVPGIDSFDVVLNTETGKWGRFEPNYSLDILHTKVPVEHPGAPVEQFTISTVEADSGVNVVVEWSDIKFLIPIKAQ